MRTRAARADPQHRAVYIIENRGPHSRLVLHSAHVAYWFLTICIIGTRERGSRIVEDDGRG